MYKTLGALFCLPMLALLGQTDNTPSLLPTAKDTTREPIRRARAIRFNVRVPFSMIERAPGRSHPFVKLLPEVQPELPHEQADTILVGSVVDIQPFMSSDGKGLYTEYTVSVDRALKGARNFPIPIAGQTVTLLREGGIVRLADGRVAKHDIRNDVTPTLNQRCLFFLTYLLDLEAFDYRKYWLVEQDTLRAAFPEDLALGAGSVIAGKPLSTVVSLLEQQIK